MTRLILVILSALIAGFNLHARDLEEEYFYGVFYDLKYKYNFKKMAEKSELVLIGNIKKIRVEPQMFKINENRYGVKDYPFLLKLYKIETKETLKGELKKGRDSFVAVDMTYNSATTHLQPTIDEHQYLFLLKRASIKTEGLPEGEYYELTKGWHGMIALEKEAVSQSAANRIKEVYEIDTIGNRQKFVDAVKLVIKKKMNDGSSEDVMALYNKLKIDMGDIIGVKKEKP